MLTNFTFGRAAWKLPVPALALACALLASAHSPARASSAGEFAVEAQFEEETRLAAPSAEQLSTLYDLLNQSTVPALSGYYFVIEQSSDAPAVVEDVYYDTEDGFLRKGGHSFRLRTTHIADGKTIVGLQFKELAEKNGSYFARSESRSVLPLDPAGDLPALAQDWVSGKKPCPAYNAARTLIGHEPGLRPALGIKARRAEVLMYAKGATLENEYLADIFLDEVTASRNGEKAVFYVVEAEANDRPELPPGRSPEEFKKAAVAAIREMSGFLERDPRLAFRPCPLNKYQTGWKLLEGSPQSRRFSAHAGPMSSVLDSRLRPEEISRKFIDSNMRQYAFRLEELLRLYVPRRGARFEAWLKEVGDLETRTGDCMRARDSARAARDAQAPQAAVEQLLGSESDCVKGHALFLTGQGWIAADGKGPSRLDALLNEVRAVNWESPEDDRAYLLDQLRKGLGNLERAEFDMKEFDTGMHELRRRLREVILSALALNGMIQLKDEAVPDPRFKALLTQPVAKDKYAQFPPPESGVAPCRLPRSLFLGLVQYVAELGRIKDAGESQTILAGSLLKTGLAGTEEEAGRRARDLIRNQSKVADITGAADRLYADLRDSRLLEKLDQALESCAKTP